MSEEELDLVETDDLLRAIGRRFTAVLVITAKDTKDGKADTLSSWWSGGFAAALGLSHWAVGSVERSWQRTEDTDGDEM